MRQSLSGTAGLMYDAGHMVGNMAPSIASNAVLPGSGTFMMGLSAKGNAQKEALEAGKDPMKAQVYGAAIGLSEAVLQKVLGGITNLGGGGVLMKGLEGNISAIKSGIVRGLAQYGVSAISGRTPVLTKLISQQRRD